MHQLKDVMSHDVKVLRPDATIKDAAGQMRDGDFGMMPIEENDRMIGAISDRDIVIRAIAAGKGASTKVRDIMSDRIMWAYETESVEKACEIMKENRIRRLPIVNADKRLVGIVSLGDLATDKADTKSAGQALSEISRH